MMAQPDLAFDPWDPAFVADPYPADAELRARGRAHWFEPTNPWLVPPHADVSALLRDRRLARPDLQRFPHEDGGRVRWLEPTSQSLVPHHADVSALLRDRRLGRTYLHRFPHEEFGRTPPPPEQEPFHTLNDHGMLDLEPPDHTRIRRLVSKAFTPRTVERLKPYVEGLAGDLVTALVDAGGGDLLRDVAEPLPVAVIAEMLGI